MGDDAFVKVERRDDGVVLVRLDRPPANALSAALLGQLAEAARRLTADPPGAVVVWGGGRIFAAGADISELDGPEQVSSNFEEATGALAAVPRVTIAAINGYALGGGLELALACDLRICAADAKLGLPEVLLGVIPGGGGTQRLPRLIGPARAKELVVTGRQVRAEEAHSIGLVTAVVPRDEVLDAALAQAGRLAAGAVVAQALGKSAVDRGLEMDLDEGLAFERQQFLAATRTEDASIGVRSFLEHGPGRAPFVGR